MIALCGGIVLEEALDLSFDRLLMMMMMIMMMMRWGKRARQPCLCTKHGKDTLICCDIIHFTFADLFNQNYCFGPFSTVGRVA